MHDIRSISRCSTPRRSRDAEGDADGRASRASRPSWSPGASYRTAQGDYCDLETNAPGAGSRGSAALLDQVEPRLIKLEEYLVRAEARA